MLVSSDGLDTLVLLIVQRRPKEARRVSLREKLRHKLDHRPGRGRPQRLVDLGLLPMSNASKVQEVAEDAGKTETPQQHEREEFGTEL
jgi:hypothetical protein